MANGSFIDDLQDIPGLNVLTTRGAPEFGHAADELDEPKAAPQRETFACESCGGTGRYRGVRLHQPATECFACNGRGFFYKSRADRMASRAKAAARKSSKLELAQGAFEERYPGLIASLREIASWHTFAAAMIEAFTKYGALTDKQAETAQRSVDKVAAGRAAKQEARSAMGGAVSVAAIEAMFDTARASGLKKLAFAAGGLHLSPAKATSANAGALYVKRDGIYQGKIMGGKFMPGYEAKPDTITLLNEISANPSQAARDYGKRTGTCCCCQRELTDPASIEAGIGPVCATKWGL